MPLEAPNLDDRTFRSLVEDAKQHIRRRCPEWTDLSVNDPGVVLVEAFAFLTELAIYRLNRVPEKVYVELLRLLGVTLHPPAAATVEITFVRSGAPTQRVVIPRGTRVSSARAAAGGAIPLFTTLEECALEAGATEVGVRAAHAEPIAAELVGRGDGRAGQWFRVAQPPIVAPLGSDGELVVAVEANARESVARERALVHAGKTFAVWREVASFAELGADRRVYSVDRGGGLIRFAPAARLIGADGALAAAPTPLADVPEPGREVRVWYLRGGGACGNVVPGALTVLRDALAGVRVEQRAAALGGRDGETLENALVRGPREIRTLERAVTASDYEELALRNSAGVARAKAFTRAALWKHAAPGSVEVVLVPDLPDADRPNGRVGARALGERADAAVLQRVREELDARRPLGTQCHVRWAGLKEVRIHARVVGFREQKRDALEQRLLRRLHAALSPLPDAQGSAPWAFGRTLHASDIYHQILSEPGVKFVEPLRVEVADAPATAVEALCADAFQPATWHAAAGAALYRSMNDADGWERTCSAEGETFVALAVHGDVPGLVAALSTRAKSGGTRARVHLSFDAGETWSAAGDFEFGAHDLAFASRAGAPVLYVATDRGLYERAAKLDATPLKVDAGTTPADLGFYAVATTRGARGESYVAAAAQQSKGVYLSCAQDKPGSFRRIGLDGRDIRVLSTQIVGPRVFLWAGETAIGSDPGQGALSRELVGDDRDGHWDARSNGWSGGSCRAFAFVEETTYAATGRDGVVKLPRLAEDAAWQRLKNNCGLPWREQDTCFAPVAAVAASKDGTLLAGGERGVFRATEDGERYVEVSAREFTGRVPLPPTWLFCSGEHALEVVSEDAGE